MIEQVWSSLKPWQLSVFGFALSWWLLLAPAAIRHLWPLLLGNALPEALGRLLPLSWLLAVAGAVLSLNDLDAGKPMRARIMATYFWLGLLAMGLLGSLGLIPSGIF